MKIPRFKPSSWSGCFVGGTLAILAGLLCELNLGNSLRRLSYDLPFYFRSTHSPNEAVIVYIDDNSRRELAQESAGWDRSLHAQLLDRLSLDQPKAIVLDIVFSAALDSPPAGADPDTLARSQTDQRLARAIRQCGNVVLAGLVLPADDPGHTGERLDQPAELFRSAAAGWGIANLSPDSDRCIRRIGLPAADVRERQRLGLDAPSLTLAAAAAAGLPVARDTAEVHDRWLNYYGPPGSIPHVSFFQALPANGLAPGFFRDKVVFVGEKPSAGFSGETIEEFATPYTSSSQTFSPGVEVQATSYVNLARRDWLTLLPLGAELFLLFVTGALAGCGFLALRPMAALGAGLGAAIAVALAGIALPWLTHTWFAWLTIAAVQIPVALLWSLGFNSYRLHLEKRVLQESLSLHLSPARVRQLLKRPDLLRPGAERQEVSIMFTDIANFSKITARMDPEDLFKMLNAYYERALNCVHDTDGTVIKLIGDAIFAIWNAPFVQPDQQERACRAALKLQSSIVAFEETVQSLPLRTRVGLHTGFAFVGNVGSTRRFDYTAIGDNINLASRLEGLNKHLGTEILATRDLQKIVEKTVASRKVGYFRFKGVDRVTEVHEIIGDIAQAADTAPWREAFERGLFQFERRMWDAAGTEFKRAIDLKTVDGPSQFYLERIAEFRSKPPADDWTGEIELKEK